MNVSGSVTQKISISGNISVNQSISGKIDKPTTVYKDDYNDLKNKPSINGTQLEGNKTSEEIGITAMTNMDIERLINSFA